MNIKTFFSLFLVSALALSLAPARADLAVGYELLTVLPHAFVLSYNDKVSGWGVKASADFGSSAFSAMGSILSSLASLGLVNAQYSFVTLSLTKDIAQEDNFRDYLKAGAMVITGKTNTQTATATIPLLGIGREWPNFINQQCSLNVEAAYPELLTIGMRYHF